MLQLTTPYNPGDADPGASYTHVKITSMRVVFDEDEEPPGILLTAHRGTFESSVWARGAAALAQTFKVADHPEITDTEGEVVTAADPQYTTMIAALVAAGDVGERKYDVIAKELYQWLIDQGHFVGTYV